MSYGWLMPSSASLSLHWGFLPFPGLAFNCLILLHLLHLPHLLIFLCFLLPFCLLLLLPPSLSPPVLPLHPLPQVVQDLLPLIFQLRRWFLRCPNCSSLCFQHETRRRSWDLRHTTSRSAETMKWSAVQLRKLTLWLLNRVEFSHLTSSKLC